MKTTIMKELKILAVMHNKSQLKSEDFHLIEIVH